MRRCARLSNGNRCIPRRTTAAVRRACACGMLPTLARLRASISLNGKRASLRRSNGGRNYSVVRHSRRNIGEVKWPGKHRRSLKSRLAWKSTCTPAQRASKPRCDDLPGSGASALSVVPFPEPRRGRHLSLMLASLIPLSFILHKRSKRLGVIRMPARQRGPVFDDVAGRPENPPLIELSRHVVVRTENIEISGPDPLDHEVDGLLRRPGPGRLLGAAFRGETGKGEAGDEKMRADAALGRVAQFVLQRFGKRLHAGLRDIVGGI